MREDVKYIEFTSVLVIQVLQNIPFYNMQKRLMMVVREKKSLQKKSRPLFVYIFRAVKSPTFPYVCA